MTVLKGIRWVKQKLGKSWRKLTDIRLQNLTAQSNAKQQQLEQEQNNVSSHIDGNRSVQHISTTVTNNDNGGGRNKQKNSPRRSATASSTKSDTGEQSLAQHSKAKKKPNKNHTAVGRKPDNDGKNILIHRLGLVKTATVLGAVTAIVWGGHAYVKANLVDVVEVALDGEDIGIVQDKTVVEQFVAIKTAELQNTGADVHVDVEMPELSFKEEKAFVPQISEQEVFSRLSSSMTATPMGVQLLVDGKPMGILKDQATADHMLEAIKADITVNKKEPGKVQVLSASPSEPATQVEIQQVDFVQKVELKEIPIQPQDVIKPDELRKKLETGDVQPTKYTVQEGDCVSCIAKKLNVPKQAIYENNPWIADDMIKAGEELDLTVSQPALAVRSVEKVTETHELHFDTEYQQDPNTRVGTDQTIRQGQNGVKKVTIQVTKVNGMMVEETVQNEEIVQQPVSAIIRKGAKVVKGEGSGKFAWPVISSSISSTYGTRWGRMHKGIDLVSSNKNILAADNGKVIYAGNKQDGYGNCVIIDHLNGYKTLYGHLSKIDVVAGEIVEKGEKIGDMGSTGDSTGVHLHFEIQKNNTPENPSKYLNR
ncbi:M23 family metallopeptidase [Paenibacillus xerothermodurans]|uniref:LysM peptidoglycan-binding domain-containing protein n=1 Tax=Paenibacillus xerothermodurans TaxID=1977292 RepID=A0A2W1NTS2_PAEXE|nr:M23 family metallopeptidase [Paenibacillus xerothermodurans]PZE19062.1 LysM peptidoglycan-binding domain-containing protein [Paenibacillus xerothermodurans]